MGFKSQARYILTLSPQVPNVPGFVESIKLRSNLKDPEQFPSLPPESPACMSGVLPATSYEPQVSIHACTHAHAAALKIRPDVLHILDLGSLYHPTA